MQINLAAAENMTANELFSAIQLLDNSHLGEVLPILLNKIDDIIAENHELKKELEDKSVLKDMADEVDDLRDRLDQISRLADY
ncbi:hypothetical protein DM558_07800 [Entomomonas moraniae]|uniref:Uncharacterized protein n=1 Tax=Entomomonas moraniae TaxID=2213226 RepID=A0A3S9XEH0_9GAMM|nr:hypothetical protein [Entomomonas moraniae]AZS50688.1 hypothetical protein DM558_07800 [Entomomonas moraniae]